MGHALHVLLRHETECALLALGQVQRIHEAQPAKRLVASGQLVIGVLDIQRRDVIGQQHHLVGEKLLAVHPWQVFLRDAAQQVHGEVARAGAGIEHVDVRVAQRLAKLAFE